MTLTVTFTGIMIAACTLLFGILLGGTLKHMIRYPKLIHREDWYTLALLVLFFVLSVLASFEYLSATCETFFQTIR